MIRSLIRRLLRRKASRYPAVFAWWEAHPLGTPYETVVPDTFPEEWA